MRIAVPASSFLAALALVGCQPPAEPSSLVGATKPPPLFDLERETIIYGRNGGRRGEDHLNIEIRPENSVVVAVYRNGDTYTPTATESLRLSSTKAGSLRRMLWRLRPNAGASGQQSIPIGCQYNYDVGSMWGVTFLRTNDPIHIVTFELPYPEYCKSHAYEKARELMRQVLEALPRSDIIRSFPPEGDGATGTYTP